MLGQIIYTDYVYMFQAAGLVLLVAMIGAIVLTHRKRPGVKKQNIANQLARSAKESVEMKKVETGRGI
jgi:NADH-quinone oxidoreductase subunit J